MKALLVLVCALPLAAACGEIRKPKGNGSRPTPSAGKSGTGGAGESNGVSGGAAVSSSEGGEGGVAPGDTGGSGAPTAGRGGAFTAGGAGVAGTAGAVAGAPAGGAAGVVAPDGCELVSEHGTSLYCSAELSCLGDRAVVSCTAQDSGAWLCTCVEGTTSFLFEFPGTSGAPTCSTTAKACRHPELLTGEETCTLADEVTTTTCVATETCRRQHEIDGVKLATTTEWTASCHGIVGTDFTSCSCSDGVEADYWLTDVDFSVGCPFLDPLCRGAAPTPKTDWDCTTDFEEAGPNYGCHTANACRRAITLADGSELTLRQGYNVNCRTVDGHALCACEDMSGQEKLTLRLDISADDIVGCRLELGACAGLESIELAETPECTTTTADATETYCQRIDDCTQEGVTARTQVTALTKLGASCNRHDDGSWFCTCKTAGDLLDGFELSADDAEGACSAAIERCPRFAPGFF